MLKQVRVPLRAADGFFVENSFQNAFGNAFSNAFSNSVPVMRVALAGPAFDEAQRATVKRKLAAFAGKKTA